MVPCPDGVLQIAPTGFVNGTIVASSVGKPFAINHAVWLADIHDIRIPYDLARPKTPGRIPNIVIRKVFEELGIGHAPVVNFT
jgi:hypothetical protein